MERTILTAKRPSRKLTAQQSQLPAGQTEATTSQKQQEQQQEQQQQQQFPLASPELPQQAEQQPQQPPPPQEPQAQQAVPPSTSSTTPAAKIEQSVTEGRLNRKVAILEAKCARLTRENMILQTSVKDHENLINAQASALRDLSSDHRSLQIQSGQATPKLQALEDEMSDNMSQVSELEGEVENTTERTMVLVREHATARREVSILRRFNKSLVKTVAEGRQKISHLEAVVSGMKFEIDAVVEERIRHSVLEAENAALRIDIASGMEQIRWLAQSQQHTSSELNAEDAEAEEKAWRERQRALERDWDTSGERLGIEFRGDSIWEEWEAGPHSEADEGASAAEADVQVASTATQTTPTPPPSPSPSSTPVAVVLASTATQTTPPPSPPSPPLLLLTAPTPPSSPVLSAAPSPQMPRTSGPTMGTQTEEKEEEEEGYSEGQPSWCAHPR